MPPAVEPFGSGTALVFDTSAWNRQHHEPIRERWDATMANRLLVCCPVIALELLSTARNEQAFLDLGRNLADLPQAPVTRAACDRALAASRELKGGRRLPATDYLIAAAAAERGFGVLHYDRHFEPLCRAMGIQSVAVAEWGELD
jgi:predicted nucleic acid-binding protein